MLHDMTSDHRHGHGSGVPAACGEPPEVGFGRFLIGEMEWLRIVFPSEIDNFFASYVIGAEIGLGPDFQVFEIDHRQAHSPANWFTLR